MNSQTEEIKAKLDIVDLVSEYIQLKQAGTNWRANCPFHNEKTPSFMVSRDKQIWHCFGCHEGGDIFTFVQKIESMEFPEALRLLADKAGVKLKKINPAISSQRNQLLEISHWAAEFFHKALLIAKEAQIGRDYLLKRKLKEQTVKDFKIGYAPDSWDKLLLFLQKKGFNINDILLSGMAVKNERGQIYDRFRQRLMFPINDANGNCVGFTGRVLDESKENQGGKYVNTPQTMLYNKSLILYGLDKAKQTIKSENLAVIVEGNMDVIASHQVNVKNVIASSGTALTLEQLKLLQRYTNNLALCFDADLAGQVAAERGIDTALSLGYNIKVIQLPKEIEGQKIKDPDDCIKQGAKYWKKAIKDAVSIMEFYLQKVFNQYDKSDPQGRKEIAAKIIKQIIKITDKVEQDYWLSQLAQRLDISDQILRESFNAILDKKKENKPEQTITFVPALKNRDLLLAEQILALLIKYPQNIDYAIDRLEINMIFDESLKAIYKELILSYNINKEFKYSEFEKILLAKDEKLVNILSTLMLLADKDFFDYTSEQISQEIIKIIGLLRHSYISQKINQVQKLLAQAEHEGNAKQIQELSKDFSVLTQELNNL